ncbi:hypothetical protein QJS10_CPA01g01415 [Acorus calamus]|uniref:Uncharacterized protein n=1 Tax=Acorus calamus TaxID=4465 RepID=A0AAV9FI88_ACOCL|nr:hypothetical protein QJS10_CPA01g01415 [Acorus calamus]
MKPSAVFGVIVSLVFLCSVSADPPTLAGAAGASLKPILGGGNLEPLTKGLLKFSPEFSPAYAPAQDPKVSLVLAAERTKRPDILSKFRWYEEGWNITNRHYWASVGFTGAPGFILAIVWLLTFGLALGLRQCCKWKITIKDKEYTLLQRICLALLLVFTCAASTGCILLSVGQNEFHSEALGTLNYVVNQSDFTVQILRNVTEYLSIAKTINVDQVDIPLDAKNKIDKLNVELNDAASMLSEKTNDNSNKIKSVFDDARCALIVVAAVMLLLAIIGFLLSILGHRHAMYIFIFSGWVLVAVTFLLLGAFLILNSAIADTCIAMDEWVENPQAETALSNILPCVNEQTTNQTLHQSKQVIFELVNVVNTAISNIANTDFLDKRNPYYYNQSGPPMPSFCSPVDSQLNLQDCEPQEVSFANASTVWRNYTCMVSDSGMCISPGRVTPDIYNQLVSAVNASYALYYYAPFLLSLQSCGFVRATFNSIISHYCPRLEHDLAMVNAGLALISTGVLLCLVLWILHTNRPQREEVFVKPSMVNEVNPC